MAVQRRNTRQRKLVLDAVRQSYNHPTADEIYNAVREQDDKISRGTVYRNLNLLADAGEILSIKTPGGSRFDRTIEPHAHIICTSCSRVIDVPLPFDAQLDARASEQIGWSVSSHYTIFEGLCPDCQQPLGHACKSTCPSATANSTFLGMSQISTRRAGDAVLLRPCARSGRGR